MDGHRTYMSFAGHSEHSLFVHALLQPGGIAKIPGGPKSNLGKKRKKPLPKKSAHLKRMLRAPSSQNSNVVPAEILSEVRPDDACDLLPGSVTESSQRAVVEAAGQEKEVLCMSTTLRGDRCKRKRTHGCFCSHHCEISSTEKWSLQLYESVQEPASHAMHLWEERVESCLATILAGEPGAYGENCEKQFLAGLTVALLGTETSPGCSRW